MGKGDAVVWGRRGETPRRGEDPKLFRIHQLAYRSISYLRWPTRDMLQIKETLQTKKETLQTKKERCK